MATQGMVCLVTEKKEVLIKAITGCNGMRAKRLQKKIIDECLSTREAIYKAALEVHFGCPNCLVVMDSIGITKMFEGDVDSLYRETFKQANFNPRWSCGVTEHFEMVTAYTTDGKYKKPLSVHTLMEAGSPPIPLGLMPSKIAYNLFKEKRYIEVCEAIKRYWDEGETIPIEWITEYNELSVEIEKTNPALLRRV